MSKASAASRSSLPTASLSSTEARRQPRGKCCTGFVPHQASSSQTGLVHRASIGTTRRTGGAGAALSSAPAANCLTTSDPFAIIEANYDGSIHENLVGTLDEMQC